MSEMKHTPGPWHVEMRHTVWAICCNPTRRGEYSDICYQELDGHPEHGSITGRMRNNLELAANANLISAAPDLLDAITDLIGGCGKEGDLFSPAAHEKAQAAIAKAEGRAS